MEEEDYKTIRSHLLKYDGGKIEFNRNFDTGIAFLCLNNPEKKNAISGRMMVDLYDYIEVLEKWNEGKAVIIYGNGNNFCSGADLNLARNTGNAIGAHRMCTWMYNTLDRLQRLSLLSVCIVDGPTLGGGAEISIFCDYIVTTNKLQYGFVQGKMGIITAWGGASRLSRKIGENKALDMLVTSKIISAKECFDIGLVQYIVTGQDVLDETIKWLEPRLQHHATIIHAFKNVISKSPSNYYEALEYEKNRFIPFWGGKINVEALSKHIKHTNSS